MYTIQLKKDAEPVIHAPHRVPAPLRERLKKELDRMSHYDVIIKVEEPTEWVNSMVNIDKKNKNKYLEICMDPRDLNKNLKCEHLLGNGYLGTKRRHKPGAPVNQMKGKTVFTK